MSFHMFSRNKNCIYKFRKTKLVYVRMLKIIRKCVRISGQCVRVINMTTNELKKLSRADLLEMLIEQSEEVEKLRALLTEAEVKLGQREVILNEAGSIAEASLQLNGIFEAAQYASKQYLESIQFYSAYQKLVCEKRERQLKMDAERCMEDAKRQCKELETKTRHKCTEMVLRARIEAKACWDEITEKLEEYYAKNPELRQVLTVEIPTSGQE